MQQTSVNVLVGLLVTMVTGTVTVRCLATQLQTSDTKRFEHEHAGTSVVTAQQTAQVEAVWTCWYISLNRTADTVRFEHEHASTSVSTPQHLSLIHI